MNDVTAPLESLVGPEADFASLTDSLGRHAERTPDRVSYIFLADGETELDRLTYAELNERALAIAAALTRRCAPGARAILLYPPGLDFVAAFFGCLYAGVTAVPAYPPRSPRMMPRLSAILADAQPEVALALSTSLPRIRGWMERTAEGAGLAWLATDPLEPARTGWKPAPPAGDAIALLQYTSGSTSTPKGVMVTHSNLAHNQRVIQEACGHSEESVFVSWLPPYHDLGLIGNLLQATWVGAPCVLMAPVAFLQNPSRWLSVVSRYRATTSGGPNFAYDLCVRKVPPAEIERLDLSSWQVAFNGAEPVRESTLVRFAEAFSPAGFRAESWYPCYGLAEATLMVAGGRPGQGPTVRELGGRRLVGCGRILPGNAAVVVDPDSGVPCLPDTVGEIWVSGGSIARGYWNRPQETAHAFGATLPDGRGPWLRTGDLGILDGGELFVAGRLKDLIIRRGKNHYPQDLEATAGNAHPALAGGAAAAFAVDGETEEELVIVHEVDRHGVQGEEIAAAVRQAVAEEHEVLVHDLVWVPAGGVPRTTSGKVQRRLCRELYLRGELRVLGASRLSQAEAAIDPAAAPPGSLAWLCQAFAAAARIDPAQVDPDRPLSAQGLDSLAAVELKQTLEAGTGIHFPIPELLAGITLREAQQRVATAAPAEAGPAGEAAGDAAGEHRLSWNQRSLWFLHQRAPQSSAYNIAGAARVTGVDAATLGMAFQKLMDRHPMLRATFEETADGPLQRVPEWAPADFVHVDARDWTDEEIRRRLHVESFRPFDLSSGPPLRAALLERGGEAFLSLAVHHIVADFWSIAVLIRELGALCAGRALQPPEGLYIDYAREQERLLAEDRGERLREHWQERLAGAPQLDLPTDRPRRPVQALCAGAQTVPPAPERSAALHRLAAAAGCTSFVALLAAWQAVLGRWSGQDDFLLGAPTAGRSARAWRDTVGYFVNPVALRADLAGDPTAGELLARAQATTFDALEHQELPFAVVTELLRPVRDPSRPALVPAMLTLQRAPLPELENLAAFALGVPGARLAMGELSLESVPLEAPAAQLDLSLMAAELPGGLALLLQWDADLFDAATVGRMLDHLDRLLAGMAQSPQRRIGEIDVLSPAEKAQLVAVGRGEYPREATVHGLFEEQAQRAPERAAVTDGEGVSTTYAELSARANQLAHHLLAMGVIPETPVGVALESSPETLVALLGILKAGGAYVPLDPAYPRERLALMIDEVRMPILVTEERLLGALPEPLPATVLVDRERPGIARRSTADPGVWSDPAGLAYVVFTSGSAGRPKAVGVGHRAVVRLVRGGGFAGLGADEVFLQLAPISFDAATLEIWGPLLNGGRLVLFPRSPVVHEALGPVLARYGVTTLWLTAGLFHEVVDHGIEALRPLRQLLAGGDVLSPAHVNRVLAELPGCALINGYGPTENTTFTCCHRLAAPVPPGGSVPIGQPIAGTRVYVLDAALRLVPPGVPGELFAGGDGLARGYLRRPDLTAERFVPSPFCGQDGIPGDRLYRTGDRVRLRPDGGLEFLGRIDGQVKIRGFRVEPAEVEAALGAHPAVAAAAVVVRETAAAGKRLEAYVVLSGPAELRAWLKDRLPAFMVPAAFFPLPALPLTANGKVDRQALLRIEAAAGEAAGPQAPRTATEELLAGIWADLLGVGQVGPDDDFFALGGHSLLSSRLAVRLREALQVEIPVAAIFENPTLAAFAAIVEAAREKEDGVGDTGAARAVPPLASGPRPSQPPLSFAQERLWFLDRLEPGNAAYVVPLALRLRGPLAVASLAGALTAVVRRHEALRTTFAERSGRPVQEISARPEVPLRLIDLAGLLPEARQAAMARHLREEARRPFDLTAGPLVRAVLLRLQSDEHLLLLNVHHIVFDGWSAGILLRELGLFYAAAGAAQPAALPPLAVQYPDFALWQRRCLDSGALAGQLAFWRQRLAGAPAALDLPLDRPRPDFQTFRGAAEPVTLPEELVRSLRRLARQHGASLFMTVLAGWSAVLHRAGGAPEVVVGTPVANRQRPELEGLIGLFVNTLPLRVDISADPPFHELLDRVRESALTAYDNQDVPFERLVEGVAAERDLTRSPLFQAMLALEDGPGRALHLPDVACELLPVHNGTAKLELLLALAEAHGGLAGGLEFNTDLFEAATARRLAAQLARLLTVAAAEPQLRVGDLPLLDAAEQRQLLVEWNATAAPFPRHLGLHELFEAQAARTPQATALIHGAERLSYRELEAWADDLAQRLRALGVGPEVLVGVFCGRTPALVAATLAVLKAGGAYLPLDPAYPAQRLAFLLDDAGVGVVLTEEGLAAELPPFAGTRVPVGRESGQPPAGQQPRGFLHPEQAAYAIYTSGSTGTPKGVVIRHAGAVARVAWALAAYAPEALAGVLAATSLCFDLSVFEVFVPLTAGGAVVLADDALALPALPAASEVTLVNTVPSAMAELVRSGALPRSVRVVNLAGEPLRRDLAARLYSLPGVDAVHNLYGPSEDTTYSTGARVERSDARQPAIGRSLPNSRAYVLDPVLRPVPVGTPGELWLGGEGLARGYLRRPDLTADRFRPDPFGPDGGRLYRTGDLARRRTDGDLDYLGRLDHQVKVRGFRIELGEVEAALLAHPEVREAAVLALAGGESRRLVACVAPAGVAVAGLRQHLAARLPAFMVPAGFLTLPGLPLTPNGKVDRQALARLAPGAAREGRGPHVAPRNALEELLATLWTEVLEVERMGAHDDFFTLGGHSLAAVRLVSRVHELFGVRLPVRQLFQTPTLANMAEALADAMAAMAGDELLAEITAEVLHG